MFEATLLLALLSVQQKPVIKAEKQYEPYKLVRLAAENVPAKAGVVWRVRPSKAVDKSSCSDKTKLEFVAPPGSYDVEILVVTVAADGQVEIVEQITTIIIGEKEPVPPPTPPTPPTPPPTPDVAPIPVDGFRALLLYESEDLAKMPQAQSSVLFSKEIREYLDKKCVIGADGVTREWRVWDKDTNVTAEANHWQEAMKRPRKSIPWIIISDGKKGFEGPLPANVSDTMKLLKQYGGE